VVVARTVVDDVTCRLQDGPSHRWQSRQL